jgi:hypothetical protein
MIIGLAFLGQRQRPRRADQKPDAEPGFEARDQLADG